MSDGVTVEFTGTDAVRVALAGMEGRIAGANKLIAEQIALSVVQKAKDHAPVLTGTLRRSIGILDETAYGEQGWQVKCGPGVIYGRIRELGGDIYPVHAKFLRFTYNGRVIFSKHVHQEGTHYFQQGFDDAKPYFSTIASRGWQTAMQG